MQVLFVGIGDLGKGGKPGESERSIASGIGKTSQCDNGLDGLDGLDSLGCSRTFVTVSAYLVLPSSYKYKVVNALHLNHLMLLRVFYHSPTAEAL